MGKKKIEPPEEDDNRSHTEYHEEDKNVENSESPEENDAAGKVLVDTLKAFEIMTQRFQSDFRKFSRFYYKFEFPFEFIRRQSFRIGISKK